MPNLTTNLQLKKPTINENYDINAHNYNSDIIDTEIKALKDDMQETNTRIDNIDLTATKVTIDDTGNKFTSTTVEGALSELFQYADSGKNTIVTAIGSPLVNTDSFVDMGTKIDTLTQTLKNNLTSKGQSVSEADKISTLINKVSNINKANSTYNNILTVNMGSFGYGDFNVPQLSSLYDYFCFFCGNIRFSYEIFSENGTGYPMTSWLEVYDKNGTLKYTSNVLNCSTTVYLTHTVDLINIEQNDTIKLIVSSGSRASVDGRIKNVKIIGID